MTLREDLQQDPARFAFDAALRILMHAARTADPAQAARFVSPPQLAYPAAEIISVDWRTDPPAVLTPVAGLTGPAGALPRGYTEAVTQATRGRAHGLRAFLDMLAQRFVAGYAEAGAKYRLHRIAEAGQLGGAPDQAGMALLALTGHLNGDQVGHFAPGAAALRYYGGLFSAYPRSGERLTALAADWLDRTVRLRQFAGAWLLLPPAERTSLPTGRGTGQFNRLGIDAAIGVRAWDIHARVILQVGPLSRPDFEALLPDQPQLARFAVLVRAYLGFETGFAVNLVLRRDSVPPLLLDQGQAHPPRLGWNTWLTAPPSAFLRDPEDALFEAETVAAQAEAPPASRAAACAA